MKIQSLDTDSPILSAPLQKLSLMKWNLTCNG